MIAQMNHAPLISFWNAYMANAHAHIVSDLHLVVSIEGWM